MSNIQHDVVSFKNFKPYITLEIMTTRWHYVFTSDIHRIVRNIFPEARFPFSVSFDGRWLWTLNWKRCISITKRNFTHVLRTFLLVLKSGITSRKFFPRGLGTPYIYPHITTLRTNKTNKISIKNYQWTTSCYWN